MLDLFKQFWNDESGQTLTEYALILALVSIGLMLVLVAFRNEVGRVFNAITGELENAAVNQVQTT